MATFSPAFLVSTKTIHGEHTHLLSDLNRLTAALNRLDCYSEAFADLSSVDEVRTLIKRLCDSLPEHFDREEETVLQPVTEVSPELRELVGDLKKEHEDLRAGLATLSLALAELDSADDLYDAIWYIKELGTDFIHKLGRHVAVEEHELAGFL